MPPEQLRGQTSFASDLYSLGATLLFLLTQKTADELPQQRMKIDFRAQVKLSDRSSAWLENILEPIAEDRFQSVVEAISALLDESISSENLSPKYPQPAKSHIIFQKTNRGLKIDIPHAGIQGKRLGVNLNFGVYSIFWIVILCLMSYIFYFIAAGEGAWHFLLVSFCSFTSFLFIFLKDVKLFLYCNFGNTHIEIDDRDYRICKSGLGLIQQRLGKTENIRKVKQQSTDFEERETSLICCTLYEEKHRIHFAEAATLEEQKWLVSEITTFLDKIFNPFF
jgi:eukaryotic-like serine/threonine-protein kinase